MPSGATSPAAGGATTAAAWSATRTVFSQGFTTRSNGHGFGLHSCALAAHSDGPARGAVFTLDIPIDAQESMP